MPFAVAKAPPLLAATDAGVIFKSSGVKMRFFYRSIILGVSIGFIPSMVFAEPVLNEKYRQNYISQLTPMIEQKLLAVNRSSKKNDIKGQAGVLAKKMANCQLEAIEHYPNKYKDASVTPVANGEDLRKVTNDVNLLMKSDIEAGSLSLNMFQQLVTIGAQKFKKCMN